MSGERRDLVPAGERFDAALLVGGDVAGGLEVFEEGDVAGGEVVAVHGVLDEQFPVGSGEVALGAGEDVHPVAGVVGDHADVVGGLAEVVGQRRGVGVEGDEDEVVEDVEAWHRSQAQAVLEVRVGRVGVGAGQGDEVAFGVERPGVVEAAQVAGVAVFFAAHGGAAVGAGVEERAHDAVDVAEEDQLAAAECAHLVVARFGDFGGVAEVEPAASPQQFPFAFEHLDIAVGGTVDAEDARLPILLDEPTPPPHPRHLGDRHRRVLLARRWIIGRSGSEDEAQPRAGSDLFGEQHGTAEAEAQARRRRRTSSWS